MKSVADYITTIPDYPKEGILFRDITTLLNDADGFALAVDEMSALVDADHTDVICGVEARGFIFGAAMAYKLHKPFVLIRKAGKLPRQCVSQSYDLEYGSATIELHKDDLAPGSRVCLVDDLMATGGTSLACAQLIEKVGAKVASFVFLSELTELEGRKKLAGYTVQSVIKY
jgi:adenine phosphoribosyltransferase